MAFKYLDRVLETFTTTGTGDIAVAGAVTGYQGWATLDDQDTAPYCAVDSIAGAWEVGTALVKKSPAQDSSFASVAVLCHADGTNLSTTFSNDATMPGAPTLASTNSSLVYITTAEKKFGTGSMRFPTADSTYCAVLLSATSALDIGTGDFTAEMFIKRLAGAGSVNGTLFDYEGAILGSTNANSFAISMYHSGLYFYKGSSSAGSGTYACSIGDGSWHHVAWSRTSGVSKLFYDGAQLASFTDTASYNQTAAKGITLGGNATVGADSSLNSRSCIDEFRLTVGVGRYTAAFTPTSTIFGTAASSGAVSLERAPSKSSNANALVNFAAGTKQVFLTLPAAAVSVYVGPTPPSEMFPGRLWFNNSTIGTGLYVCYYDGTTYSWVAITSGGGGGSSTSGLLFSDTVLNYGPLFYYKMDESSGTVMNDSGRLLQQNGVYNSDVSGFTTESLLSDGTGKSINIQDVNKTAQTNFPGAILSNTGWTIQAIVKLDNTSQGIFITAGAVYGGYPDFGCFRVSSTPRIRVLRSGVAEEILTTDVIPEGVPVLLHLRGTPLTDTSVLTECFINGASCIERKIINFSYSGGGTTQWCFGYGEFGSTVRQYPPLCKMAHVAAWARPLTNKEITELANKR